METETSEEAPKPKKFKKRHLIFITVLLIVVVAAGFIFWPSKKVNSPGNGTTDTGTSVAETPFRIELFQEQVNINARAFNPATVKIKKGDAVAWVNKNNAGRTIQSDSGPVGFKGQGQLGLNDMYLVTFTTVGTYTYHDSANPSIKGTVIVE